MIAYNERLGYYNAVKDLIDLIDQSKARVDAITKRLKPKKNVL